MSTYPMTVEKRERAGKGAARAVRREGFIPGVLYGNKQDPVLISITPLTVQKAFETGTFFSNVYEVQVAGGETVQALVRDVQFHPVTDRVESIDFLRVTEKTKVTVNVPVRITGEDTCPALKRGGLMSVLRTSVELVAPVSALPEFLEASVADKGMGDAVRMSEINLPDGVTPKITDRDFVIVNLLAPKLSASTEESEDSDGDAEGESTESGDE